jgi:hypothetical protein
MLRARKRRWCPWFDHLFTFTSATSIDDYLDEYLVQGFLTHEQTVRHPPGLRNGFVSLGPDYLEFWWVEDEAQFALASMEQQAFRTGRHPFGIGMIAPNVQAVHDDWRACGYAVPPVSSRAPRDAPADAPPAWSFQDIPRELLPGCLCFALTYHGRSPAEHIAVRVGPNTIVALNRAASSRSTAARATMSAGGNRGFIGRGSSRGAGRSCPASERDETAWDVAHLPPV